MVTHCFSLFVFCCCNLSVKAAPTSGNGHDHLGSGRTVALCRGKKNDVPVASAGATTTRRAARKPVRPASSAAPPAKAPATTCRTMTAHTHTTTRPTARKAAAPVGAPTAASTTNEVVES